jgi:hypothetical protein
MKKKIILKEELHEFIDDMPLDKALNLLEDYIASKLSNDEIYKKYNLEDIEDEPLKYLIPDFHYENEYCPTCKQLQTYRVSEDRSIKRLYCFQCEEDKIIDPKINSFIEFIFMNLYPDIHPK